MKRLGITLLSLTIITTGAGAQESFSVIGSLDAPENPPVARFFVPAIVPNPKVEFPVAMRAEVDSGIDLEAFSSIAAIVNISPRLSFEAEVSYLQHDIDIRRAFVLDNQDLSNGARRTLLDEEITDRIDVSELIAGHRGRVRTKTSFLNSVMTMSGLDGGVRSFIGAGLGYAEVDIDYTPGGLRLVDDEEMVPAYQLLAGAEIEGEGNIDFLFTARYRGLGQETRAGTVLPEALTVESEGLTGEIGFRYGF